MIKVVMYNVSIYYPTTYPWGYSSDLMPCGYGKHLCDWAFDQNCWNARLHYREFVNIEVNMHMVRRSMQISTTASHLPHTESSGEIHRYILNHTTAKWMLRWPVPGFSQLFLSDFSVISHLFPSYFSHFSTISQLFLTYFPVISRKFLIS